jgi:uncharacterized C2H2 Zn-finger protein
MGCRRPASPTSNAIHFNKMGQEQDVRDAIARGAPGSRVEVPCSAGFVDVLTQTEIIEVKAVRQWKAGLGQVLAYAVDFPAHKPRLHIFGPQVELEHFGFATQHCKAKGVRLTATNTDTGVEYNVHDTGACDSHPLKKPKKANKKPDYECPRCGYFTYQKTHIKTHLFKNKKPCPASKNLIELTDAIRQHVLENRVYQLPQAPQTMDFMDKFTALVAEKWDSLQGLRRLSEADTSPL